MPGVSSLPSAVQPVILPSSTAGGVSGDFTGTAKGMGGDVTVTLTLEDGKITGCTAEGKDETPGIGTLALEQLPAQIAETGSIAVDGVSTATITSDAIKEAAAAALTAAGLNADCDDSRHRQCRHALLDLSFLHVFPSLFASWVQAAQA